MKRICNKLCAISSGKIQKQHTDSMLQGLHSYFSHCHDQMPGKQQLQEGSQGHSQFEETQSILVMGAIPPWWWDYKAAACPHLLR